MKIVENFSEPTRATSGRLAYSPALYQIMSATAKFLVSFRCQVNIWKGQAEETAWSYGCNWWWWTFWWQWYNRSIFVYSLHQANIDATCCRGAFAADYFLWAWLSHAYTCASTRESLGRR